MYKVHGPSIENVWCRLFAACGQKISSHAKHHNQARALHIRCINWHLLPFTLFSKIPCLLQRQQLPRKVKSSYHNVVLQADASKPLTGVSAQCNLVFSLTQLEKTSHKLMGVQATGIRNKESKIICLCFIGSIISHLIVLGSQRGRLIAAASVLQAGIPLSR